MAGRVTHRELSRARAADETRRQQTAATSARRLSAAERDAIVASVVQEVERTRTRETAAQPTDQVPPGAPQTAMRPDADLAGLDRAELNHELATRLAAVGSPAITGPTTAAPFFADWPELPSP